MKAKHTLVTELEEWSQKVTSCLQKLKDENSEFGVEPRVRQVCMRHSVQTLSIGLLKSNNENKENNICPKDRKSSQTDKVCKNGKHSELT